MSRIATPNTTWSSVAISPGQAPDAVNRQIEQVVADLGGHKSLYSDSFYDRATFDRLNGGAALRDLKGRYDPDRRLLDLHDKAGMYALSNLFERTVWLLGRHAALLVDKADISAAMS